MIWSNKIGYDRGEDFLGHIGSTWVKFDLEVMPFTGHPVILIVETWMRVRPLGLRKYKILESPLWLENVAWVMPFLKLNEVAVH